MLLSAYTHTPPFHRKVNSWSHGHINTLLINIINRNEINVRLGRFPLYGFERIPSATRRGRCVQINHNNCPYVTELHHFGYPCLSYIGEIKMK